ncbi:MAG: alpha/beta fold hydrolase [Eubacteriales bacterium]|nr:alpha/beta fold hydrolase [Eubacteriales bacterium]
MLHEVDFQSYNQRDRVYGWVWVPAANPHGIVQLIHGFGEHARRYLHMISTLVDAGYIVCADDHVGHGKTAVENDTWGDWGSRGWETMTEDEHTLTGIVKELYPNLPYFLFGHSMGSFIAKDYISKYGGELDGVILCGTSGHFPHAEEVQAELFEAISEGRGEESDPQYGQELMGWMNERVKNVKLGNEWICDDVYVQLDHAGDPFNAFSKPTTNRALYYFTKLITETCSREWAERVPESMPIYIISGDEDPVGRYGDGVREIRDLLEESGHAVNMVLYPGYRHEIHNYSDLKDEVEDGILTYLDLVVLGDQVEDVLDEDDDIDLQDPESF